MLAIEMFYMNLYQGIRVETNPFHYISLGRAPGKQHTRICLGLKDIPEIIVKRKFINAYREEKEVTVVDQVSVISVPDMKHSSIGNQQFKHLVVKTRHPNDARLLIKWILPSAFKGKAEVVIPKDVALIGEDRATFEKDPRGSTRVEIQQHEVLAILNPGQKLTAYRDGGQILPSLRNGTLAWDGHEVKVEFGTEAEGTLLQKKYLVRQ